MTADEIVTALAKCDEPAAMRSGTWRCALCDAPDEDGKTLHREDCPWAAARKLRRA